MAPAPKLTRDGLLRILLLAALLALGVWLARNTYWEEISVPSQPRGEAATNPYYGIEHLAASLGLHARAVASLGILPRRDGVLLLDTLNLRSVPPSAILALEQWVDSGGRLILAGHVLAASAELRRWSGIKFVPVRVPAAGGAAPGEPPPSPGAKPAATTRATAVRRDCPPMQVSVDGAPTSETLAVCDVWVGNGYSSERAPAWALRDAAGIQVLRVGMGRGSVTVFGPAQLYSNTALFQHQHARVFIEAAALLRGDELWIFAPSRAEPLLALLWRLGAPALACFGLAIACSIWRSFPRFGPLAPAPPVARRSLGEQIRANARFAWRSRSLDALHAAAVRGVEENARRQIVAFDRLDPRQRVAVIAARAGIAPTLLEAAMRPSTGPRPLAERAAIALLEQARRRLLTQPMSQ
jgi:hypothetical protein